MLDVTTMSRSLDKLHKSGFLQRQPDPSSRRSFLVCLTETGRQEALIVRNLLSYMDEQTWKDFQPEEIEQFCGYLRRVLNNLEQASMPVGEEETETIKTDKPAHRALLLSPAPVLAPGIPGAVLHSSATPLPGSPLESAASGHAPALPMGLLG